MSTASGFDVQAIRRDFPALDQEVYGKPLAYLDNAATSQRPRRVIEALHQFHVKDNSSIHRGVHSLSIHATRAYEDVRMKVKGFLNARRPEEVVFVRGTTEAINLVAQSYGRSHVGPGDEVLVTAMEHHSNIVPWQMLCEQQGAHLRVAPITDAGELILEEFRKLLCPRTRIVALTHVSNALGTVNPVKELVDLAHRRGIPVLVDGAQAAPHLPVDVQDLDCDFYALSGHKMFGPTGIGVLYGKYDLLDAMPPYQGGGDMILSVTFEKTIYNHLPHKFEAGTPNISGTLGLGAAIDYLGDVGWEGLRAHEDDLLEHATQAIGSVPGVRLVGTARDKVSVVSFVLDGVHPHDVGTIVDHEGVAIRTGHHCAQPLMERFGLDATCRASLAFYNTREEIDALTRALHGVAEVFA